MMFSLDAQGLSTLIGKNTPHMISVRLLNKKAIYTFLFITFFIFYFLFHFLLHFEFDFYVSASLHFSTPKAPERFFVGSRVPFSVFSLRCVSNNYFQALDKVPECPRNALSPLESCLPELAVSF